MKKRIITNGWGLKLGSYHRFRKKQSLGCDSMKKSKEKIFVSNKSSLKEHINITVLLGAVYNE